MKRAIIYKPVSDQQCHLVSYIFFRSSTGSVFYKLSQRGVRRTTSCLPVSVVLFQKMRIIYSNKFKLYNYSVWGISPFSPYRAAIFEKYTLGTPLSLGASVPGKYRPVGIYFLFEYLT